jgi:PD-(D/E)XK nuclease superfamily
MIHEELSEKIIGAAMAVLNELKPGLDEKLYERAMIIELKAPRTQHFDPELVPDFLSRRIDRRPCSGSDRLTVL